MKFARDQELQGLNLGRDYLPNRLELDYALYRAG
jgi:hypothetical protein